MNQTFEALPWTSSELEALLLRVIEHGSEMAKIDFKSDIEITTAEQKAELLKDISAIANSDDPSYQNYGFLIFGVSAKAVLGIKNNELNVDNFQAQVEQLLKANIAPMPEIRVVSYVHEGIHTWVALVILPSSNRPHMFFKDFTTREPQKTRRRGEWFVRRGSTTDPGLPEDLFRIMHKQTELMLDPLRESLRNLQSRISNAEQQYNSALFQLVERSTAPTSQHGVAGNEASGLDVSAFGSALGLDLPSRFAQELRRHEDPLSNDLLAEARRLREFLDARESAIPWAPQLHSAEESKGILQEIEAQTRAIQISIATIVLRERDRKYEGAILRAMRVLSQAMTVPSGVSYNRYGESIRAYPLGILMYTIFVCGVSAGKGNLLRAIVNMPLRRTRGRDGATSLLDSFRRTYYSRELFNHAAGKNWCEPFSQRVRQIVTDAVGDMLQERSEPESFFCGEFVLALTWLDKQMTDHADDTEYWHPIPGLYLYFNDAAEVIEDFLLESPEWLQSVLAHPLESVLSAFDEHWPKAVSQSCHGDGMYGLKTAEILAKARAVKGA